MLKNLFALVFGAAFLLAVGTAMADWKPGDGHKMHWPQLPDEQGWDVNATYLMTLADDWECSESGPVLDIHFWGSWRDFDEDGLGDEGIIEAFYIRIWTNIPEDQPNIPYSRPGTMEWEMYAEDWSVVPIDPPTLEHWFDPSTGLVINNDHGNYWQYNIDIEAMGIDPFHQVAGTTYWLQISAVVTQQAEPHEWGWKSSIDHWMDDAVWSPEGALDWTEIVEPPRYNEFSATFDADGTWGSGDGTNYYSDGTDDHGWYYYDPVDPGDPADNPWYNIWFYDNPFNYENDKIAYIHGSVEPITAEQPSQVIIAVNWSTDLWSLEGTSGQPPLPGVNQSQMIGRQIIWQFDGYLKADETFSEMWEWLAYNPEWISIDVWGYNFALSGAITHECVTTSLDLAFVITGGETLGACCLQDGTCVQDTQANCETAAVNGIYVGGPCDTDGDLIDDACDGVLPTGACCWSDDSCTDPLTAYDCVSNGGTYMGDGSVCLGDSDSDGNDDLCVPPQSTGACCWPDGTCTDPISQYDCENPVGAAPGTYKGDGSVCLGDSDSDGNDDLCVPPQNTGACCWQDGSCTIETQTYCIFDSPVPGTYLGNGTVCLGDVLPANGVDDACEGLVQKGACCWTDGSCTMETQADCLNNGGDYKGDGTGCVGDADDDGIDDICEPPPGACCLDDGTCIMTTSTDCFGRGGQYLGDGSICLGDNDVPPNGVDDACEAGPKLKWFQEPDLSQEGMDVSAFYHDLYPSFVLANDFECTSPGPILEVHIFASWYLDKLPFGDPRNVRFAMSLHEDIPDPDDEGPEYSMPGALVCYMEDIPFEVRVYASNLQEGWFEPPDYYTPFPLGDRVCWEYIFYLDGTCVQEGTPDDPIVYWLDLQARSFDPDAFFGWKTAIPPHWNDDAVWGNGTDNPLGAPPWNELRLPDIPPTPGRSLDLAMAIYGEEVQPPTGACCYDDGSCADGKTAADCAASSGSYGGDASQCAGADSDGNGVDDFCDGIVTLGACCWGNPISPNCINTTQYLCELAGGGYAGTWYDGEDCASFECPVDGACCYEFAGGSWQCTITATAADCASLSPTGIWYQGQDCASIVCPPDPEGACCYEDAAAGWTCVYTTASDCNSLVGTWYVGQDCASIVCPPLGACCYGDPTNPTCGDMGLLDCDNLAGTWYEGEVCANFTCPTVQTELKWQQLPDLNCGADVNCTYNVGSGINPYLLANDFECTSTGQITKIHVYGSWYHDYLPYGSPDRVQFILSIHEDIPAGPVGFSKPGEIVCLIEQPPYQIVQYATDVVEGWLEPSPTGQTTWEPNADHVCWEYIFDVSGYDCFQFGTEGAPVVYWLDVQAYPDDQEAWFGWKTVMATQNWNDDACYAFDVDGASHAIDWRELIWPPNQPCWGGQSVDLAFAIYGIPEQPLIGACCLTDGMCIEIPRADCANLGGTYLGDFTVCEGDADNNGVDDACETPPFGACCLVDGRCFEMSQESCEKRQGSYLGDGTACEGDNDGNGIDDACEEPPFGACCLTSGECVEITADDCGKRNGSYLGDGTQCEGDADNNGVDDACEEPPRGACCLPTGQCFVMTVEHCEAYNGQYQGDDTQCEGDADQNSIDDACEPVTGACCWPDGTCSLVTQSDCENAIGKPSGIYKGDLTVCSGDSDLNGVDDACEGPVTESKWEQSPDLTPQGMDVYASMSQGNPFIVLADDFECTETGSILEIHVWGSWFWDLYPGTGPGAMPISLSLHADIPDPDGPNGPLFSQPGNLLWDRTFNPGEYTVEPFAVNPNLVEGFHIPWVPAYFDNVDHNCWLYKFTLNPGEFVQTGESGAPVVYWLDVQALQLVGRYFGWKTTQDHWNDDAVWAVGMDPGVLFFPWEELRYTAPHPFDGQSIDLAFAIIGEGSTSCCVGRVGDANGLGGDEPTIGDISVMIDALFISGDYSVIKCLPEADVNQSGGPNPGTADITIGDISTLIDYLFITGTPLGLAPCF